MTIRTNLADSSAPLAWEAIDTDTYDGAPDSPTRFQVGRGSTEAEAISNLKEILDIL